MSEEKLQVFYKEKFLKEGTGSRGVQGVMTEFLQRKVSRDQRGENFEMWAMGIVHQSSDNNKMTIQLAYS